MKKLLSVLLAALMLFSTFAISASAKHFENVDDAKNFTNKDQFVAMFDCNGSTTKTTVEIYDDEAVSTGLYKTTIGSGVYYLVPKYDSQYLIDGGSVYLPSVNGISTTMDFVGWYCYNTKMTYAGNTTFVAQKGMFADDNRVLHFVAQFEPAAAEEDTMGTIIDILCKVFGAILGLLFFNGRTEAGVQMMQEILGGIMG